MGVALQCINSNGFAVLAIVTEIICLYVPADTKSPMRGESPDREYENDSPVYIVIISLSFSYTLFMFCGK